MTASARSALAAKTPFTNTSMTTEHPARRLTLMSSLPDSIASRVPPCFAIDNKNLGIKIWAKRASLLAFLKWVSFVGPIRFKIGRNDKRFHLLITHLMQQFDSGPYIRARFPWTTGAIDNNVATLRNAGNGTL